MAHGWRERVALLGAGVLFCTGLVGCMDHDNKPVGLPKAKGSTVGAARTGGPGGTAPGVNTAGVQPAAYTTTGGAQPAANTDYFSNNSRNTGTLNAPAKTGAMGPGGVIPGPNSNVPAAGPSYYQPAASGFANPAAGMGGMPAAPTTPSYPDTRMPSSFNAPPTPALNDLQPPAAPTFSSTTPPVTPPGLPQAPLPPQAPAYPGVQPYPSN